MHSATICAFVSLALCAIVGSDEVVVFPGATNAAIVAEDSGSKLRLPTPSDGCGLFKTYPRLKTIYLARSGVGFMPSVVQLGYALTAKDDLQYLCSGTLITEQHILTAASCITSSLKSVRLGQIDRLEPIAYSLDGPSYIDRYVAATRLHPQYTAEPQLRHNIAVVLLDRTVRFATNIWPICLPVVEPQRSMDFTDYNPFVVGWWSTHPDMPGTEQLLDQQHTVLAECPAIGSRNDQSGRGSSDEFVPGLLCTSNYAGAHGPCLEPGLPLVQPQRVGDNDFRMFQTGVGSFGLNCEDKPLGYTKVQDYVNWIEANL